MSRAINKARIFLRKKIWKLNSTKAKTPAEYIRCWEKTLLLAFHIYFKDKVASVHVPALTYTSLFASVPLFAMLFALSHGFGNSEIIEDWVQETFANQPQVADSIMGFTQNYLSHTGNSYILGVGIVLMLYSLIMLMIRIESTFNHIWHTNQRKWYELLSRYTSVFVFFLILISLSLTIGHGADAIKKMMSGVWGIGFLAHEIPIVANIISLSLFFIFVFNYIPNAYTKLQCTLLPSIIAAILMCSLQHGYLWLQTMLSSYNVIYGSFAALPLYLIWLNWSWHICMFGAVLAYTNQNLHYFDEDVELENVSHEKQLLLCTKIMFYVCKKYDKGSLPTARDISKKVDIPQQLVNGLIDKLVNVRLLGEESMGRGPRECTVKYFPKQYSQLSYGIILEKIEKKGSPIKLKREKDATKHLQEEISTLRKKYIEDCKNIKLN